ncbi:helix-turn-helix domain-containing protein [Gloeocapsopsis crepidinum LEGE 06123]|uniref:Helix-turn-helix domain-containing protein n=1 Tax=Gloeocapsopsis crepidinum LEGE 06123 TaxID=588587 RepID=A0ABR9US64_9CHRO|nr:helix-turn-helix transcriptional regulator [Gloeocapsopsis crepidinum]MBE9191099.1 helix-turn-helix domain-containing protein [Gloeocapsopsis crepidinum LEGE 06123]
MDSAKRQRLEAAGWKIGTVEEFLELSSAELALIEMKLALSRKLKEQRLNRKLSQTAVARQINSSQSRVAKMEAGEPSVSTDLLIRTLLSIGATPREIAEAISVSHASIQNSADDNLQLSASH